MNFRLPFVIGICLLTLMTADVGLSGTTYFTALIAPDTDDPNGYSDGFYFTDVFDGSVSNSFWDTQTSGWPTSFGGTGKTTTQMKASGTFTAAGWNFVRESDDGTEDTWKLPAGDYPVKLAASTIYVDAVSGNDSLGTGTQTSPYRTVRKALQVASNNDRIIVLAGAYYENITMNKPVTIEAKNGLVRIGSRHFPPTAVEITSLPATSDTGTYTLQWAVVQGLGSNFSSIHEDSDIGFPSPTSYSRIDGVYRWNFYNKANGTYWYRVSVGSSAYSAPAAIVVSRAAPQLSYITISGPTQVDESSGAQYTCTAHYSDSSAQTVTNSASWSENSSYATISSSGYLTTLAVTSDRSCRITASYGGKTDTHDVTIKNAASQLSYITISGPTQVDESSGAQYTCTAHYSDSSPQTVTNSASWSENSSYATISGSGYLTTLSVTSDRSCRITASYGGKTDTHDVTIKNAASQLSYITIGGPTQVDESSGAQYTCTAHYSDSSPQTVTNSASWSENSSYATISGSGYLTTLAVTSDRSCRITASYGGKTDTHDVTIIDAVQARQVTISNQQNSGLFLDAVVQVKVSSTNSFTSADLLATDGLCYSLPGSVISRGESTTFDITIGDDYYVFIGMGTWEHDLTGLVCSLYGYKWWKRTYFTEQSTWNNYWVWRVIEVTGHSSGDWEWTIYGSYLDGTLRVIPTGSSAIYFYRTNYNPIP